MNVPLREWIKSQSALENSNGESTTESVSILNKRIDDIFENLVCVASELKITAEKYQIQINQNEIDNLLIENRKLEDDMKETEDERIKAKIKEIVGALGFKMPKTLQSLLPVIKAPFKDSSSCDQRRVLPVTERLIEHSKTRQSFMRDV